MKYGSIASASSAVFVVAHCPDISFPFSFPPVQDNYFFVYSPAFFDQLTEHQCIHTASVMLSLILFHTGCSARRSEPWQPPSPSVPGYCGLQATLQDTDISQISSAGLPGSILRLPRTLFTRPFLQKYPSAAPDSWLIYSDGPQYSEARPLLSLVFTVEEAVSLQVCYQKYIDQLSGSS